MSLLMLRMAKNSLVVSPEDIIRVEASSNYSCIYFADGKKIVVTKVLNWFEETLPEEMFARVHRSHLVNKLFIQQVDSHAFKNLLLQNGEIITISRRRQRQILAGSLILDCDAQ